jgi:glycosyltransferase involved in cell wall biosynthesis
MITLESIALEIPVITYNSGGVIEILGSKYPIVDNYSVKEYCALMLETMNNNDLRQKMIETGKTRSRLFEIKSQTEQLLQLLKK